MNITINSVTLENVTKGKARYTKAVVEYLYKGEPRTQNIMDFVNPSIFAQVKKFAPGDEIDVTLTKNAAGYNEWAAINVSEIPTDTPSPTKGVTRVTGSNYETAEERARRQVYIIKQSSLSNALEFHKLRETPEVTTLDVLGTAQIFVDYVLGNSLE